MNNNLTAADWAEIYYALESKINLVGAGKLEIRSPYSLGGPDEEWIAQLRRIKDKIGPDGRRAFEKLSRRNHKSGWQLAREEARKG